MYFYLPNIADPIYMQEVKEVIFAPLQNMGICKQITIHIIVQVCSTMITTLKLICCLV
jgi:hypothetical protein